MCPSRFLECPLSGVGAVVLLALVSLGKRKEWSGSRGTDESQGRSFKEVSSL
jgi:hypothetical protein